MGENLTDNKAIILLANSTATFLGLTVLIWTFAPYSGAHFNPAVSIIMMLLGRLTKIETMLFILCQVVGGIYLQKKNIMIALSILILTITNPDYLDHKREITKVINKYSSSSNDAMELLGESLAITLADGLIGKIIDVNSYVLFSIGSVTFKGNERNLTLGILGNVFSIESFTKPH